MMNGIWGTLAVGLFATDSAPGYSIANASGVKLTGLFYGGGVELLGLQLLEFLSVAAWTAVTMTCVFFVYDVEDVVKVRTDQTGLEAMEHFDYM